MTAINSIAGIAQLQTPEDQFFAILPLARLLIESGITTETGLGCLEFDATALLFAHTSGRAPLPHDLLRAVMRISRGEERHPSRSVRRAISARARSLFRHSPLMSPVPPGPGATTKDDSRSGNGPTGKS
jgi:hypothetical protein